MTLLSNSSPLRYLFLIWIVSLLLSASSGYAFPLTILHTNDLHAHLAPFPDPYLGKEAGGVARLAALIATIRQENPRTLLLDAGDRFSGTTLSALFQGEAECVFASLLGYDAVALGNHDFDFGQERLCYLRQRLVHPPMIAANIRRGQGGPLFTRPYLRIEREGLRILIVGLSTPETPYSTRPSNVTGLIFEPPAPILNSIIKREGGTYDLLVVLSHLGYEEDRALAEEVPGIDLIVGGHSHTRIERPERVGSTLIVQAFQWGLYLGRVDLELRGKQIVHAKGQLIPVSSQIDPDPLFTSLLMHCYEKRARPMMEEVVGYAPTPLLRQEGESLIGNLLADSFQAFTRADLALFNQGGIRADIPAGPITVGKIFEVIPFSNQVMTTDLTGEQVQSLFDQLASRGGGDAISGAQFRISQGRAEGILIGGQPLQTQKLYRVAANEFMMAGGDQFEILKQGKNTQSYGLDRQALIDYLQKYPKKWPTIEGRIQR
ncbi:MAG: bifunctional UDP-sugar hydrolase/5'-nucleotidase [candidate division NC10 bacterium]|nr:bifunctional UDP-sugar hydrolase/5'-nucleotidase [candidate division NC10 bacterium]